MTAGAEAGDADVIEEAKRRYNAHKSGHSVLPSDLRAAIFCTVVRYGPPEVVDELMQVSHSVPQSATFILLFS